MIKKSYYQNNFSQSGKITFYFLFLVLTLSCAAQNKSIDKIFSKFDGKEGVSVINITPEMLNATVKNDSNKLNSGDLISQIRSVKVLAFEKASPEDISTFESMVKDLSLKEYKELMSVKDAGESVKILLKEKGDKISEFLIIVMDGKEPVIINITGNIDQKTVGSLAGLLGLMGLGQFAKINSK